MGEDGQGQTLQLVPVSGYNRDEEEKPLFASELNVRRVFKTSDQDPWSPLLTGAHGVSPAGHDAHGSSGSALGGQRHGLDVLVQGGGLAQLDQHDVVVDVVGGVVGVTDDAGGGDELLGSFVLPDVVLAQTHLHTAGVRRKRYREGERERERQETETEKQRVFDAMIVSRFQLAIY